MSIGGELLIGLAIAVGLVGVLVPVLPGLVLVWVAVGVWAVDVGGTAGWVTFALVTALFVAGTVLKYVVPGRRLRSAGVPWRSTALGGVLGLVGFFALPVIGLPIGFLLGVYLAELARLRDHDDAVRSTRHAAVAAGWSMVIELSAGLVMALSWLVAVLG